MSLSSLFAANAPEAFWRPLSPLGAETWAQAVGDCLPLLPASVGMAVAAGGDIWEQVLGEGQFGDRRWRLTSARRLYYEVKPLLPRALTRALRRSTATRGRDRTGLGWPAEDRYVIFLNSVFQRAIELTGADGADHIDLWPDGRRAALVLTHDVETEAGQRFAAHVADLEERLGFRSSFNFVPERYRLDRVLIEDLRERGFEIGVHGLKHDGKLFRSRAEFDRRAVRINWWLRELGATGFRAPLTHRHPGWMQALDIEYDLSFFDTDPFEPMPGGTMSLWPFHIGRFVELPYTLPQDYTLAAVLGQRTPQLWIDKLREIVRCRGMALLNTHPDYLREPTLGAMYTALLGLLAGERHQYWHALPCETAGWWRRRTAVEGPGQLPGATIGRVSIRDRLCPTSRLVPEREAAAAAES